MWAAAGCCPASSGRSVGAFWVSRSMFRHRPSRCHEHYIWKVTGPWGVNERRCIECRSSIIFIRLAHAAGRRAAYPQDPAILRRVRPVDRVSVRAPLGDHVYHKTLVGPYFFWKTRDGFVGRPNNSSSPKGRSCAARWRRCRRYDRSRRLLQLKNDLTFLSCV